MEFYVVRAKKDGKTVYLKANSCFSDCFTENPVSARRFNLPDEKDQLGYFLSACVYPGLGAYAKSGVRIDEPPVIVKVKLTVDVVDLMTIEEFRSC